MVNETLPAIARVDRLKRPNGGPPALPAKEQLQKLAKIELRAATDFRAAAEYAIDFWQRSLLFLDILRQSGNQQAEMTSRPINAVAIYDYEILLRGTNLPRPVNYALVRIVPPRSQRIL